jgi:hypothetical protein
VHTIDDGADHLDIRLEYPGRDGCHVLTDTTGFLRLTTAEDVIATDLTFTANFATSRHSSLLHIPVRAANNSQVRAYAQGQNEPRH